MPNITNPFLIFAQYAFHNIIKYIVTFDAAINIRFYADANRFSNFESNEKIVMIGRHFVFFFFLEDPFFVPS